MNKTLLILAAGMGSRYGGLKQLDPLGPNGETIMDYSIAYAIQSGFDKVVFVIRKNMEEGFQQSILSRYEGKIALSYCFQELDMIPTGFTLPPDRVKPLGTAHAILTAQHSINEPFAVINADDFYGDEAFKIMGDFLTLSASSDISTFSMIGYKLEETLSSFGTVSRGVCQVNDKNELVAIKEMTKVTKQDNHIVNINSDGTLTPLSANQFVSMNFWGFTPIFFEHLENLFIDFLTKNSQNLTAEFQIPTVINFFLASNKVKIKVLQTNSSWFGVTYQEDRPYVVEQLKKYPLS